MLENINVIILLYYEYFGVLRRYIENGAGVSKWVGQDDRNYKPIFGGLTRFTMSIIKIADFRPKSITQIRA